MNIIVKIFVLKKELIITNNILSIAKIQIISILKTSKVFIWYFKSLELNSIFEFSYKDLFFYKDNYIYFLILFQKENYWAFGELFLAKYFLVFNHDQKILAFYQNYENKGPNDKSDSGGNKFIYSIVYIVIGVAVL